MFSHWTSSMRKFSSSFGSGSSLWLFCQPSHSSTVSLFAYGRKFAFICCVHVHVFHRMKMWNILPTNVKLATGSFSINWVRISTHWFTKKSSLNWQLNLMARRLCKDPQTTIKSFCSRLSFGKKICEYFRKQAYHNSLKKF